MKNIAVLTAAGIGTRMGQDIPKQFLNIDDKPIIVYTMEIFQKHPDIDGIVVACLAGWENVLEAYAKQFKITKLWKIVKGGADGQASIKNCLDAIREDAEDAVIIIHDGNRPLLSQDNLSNAIACCLENGNAITAIPCTEVLLETENNQTASGFIDREKVKRTQTPHVFYLKDILSAHQEAAAKNIPRTAASCELYQKLGRKIYFVKGSEKNIKLTTTDDIDIFRALQHMKKIEWIKE